MMRSLRITLVVLLLASPSWAVPTRTGTASEVDASAGNGSTSVTVPSDATAVIAFADHWDDNGSSTLSGLTLNSVSFIERSQVAEVSDQNGVYVGTLVNPSTGTQTLAWTWSAGGARTEGGKIVLIYVKGVDTADLVRASAVDTATNTDNVTVTVSSSTTDLVLAFAESFTPTNPAIDGTVFINNSALNSHIYDVSEIAGATTSVTVNMTNESFSSMAAISIKEVAGGGGGTTPRMLLLGVGQ